MIDDALAAELKDKLAGYLSKGAEAALKGAGGQAAKMILNLLIDGTTDPTTAKLEQIYDQLTEIKKQIKDLPHTTSVYVIYESAVNKAQLFTEDISGLLFFTK